MSDALRSLRPQGITVFGAGGRAGRAVVAEAVARGHRPTAVVRDPTRHPDLAGGSVQLRAGDALDPRSVTMTASDSEAIVSAVTPFTAPPPSFDDFDTGYYERAATALLAGAAKVGAARLIVVGLFATLHQSDGTLVLEDPALFPPSLRPFAVAHAAGVARLQRDGVAVDWIALAPPPQLRLDVSPTGSYRLGDAIAETGSWDAPLAYADLATAIIDQIETPTRHREHLAVYG